MFSFFSSSSKPLSKSEVRVQVRKARASISEAARNDAESSVLKLMQTSFEFTPGQIVAAYAAQGAELKLEFLMQRLFQQKIDVALPVVVQPNFPLQFCLWDGEESLVKSCYVPVMEPRLLSVSVVPDILLVPLVAFDRQGGRLGQGGGYYDRTISALRRHVKPKIIGVGYACQEFENLPVDETDEKLDYMVTEKEVLSFV